MVFCSKCGTSNSDAMTSCKNCSSTLIKEEYYKQFIDSTNTLCLNCNAPTNFINLQKGFSKYCSCKCANSHKDKILKFK